MAQDGIYTLGKSSTGQWQIILDRSDIIEDIGEKIVFISAQFLDVSYCPHTLIGDIYTDEQLVIDLSGVDCFTLLDYVEAMRRCGNMDAFSHSLKQVRYSNGQVSFTKRNHFFSDWLINSPTTVIDVTAQIGGARAVPVLKILNSRTDGGFLLPGIELKSRSICYIPAQIFDDHILNQLHSGDYVGVYSPSEGLDVSHVGIIVKKDGLVYLRHASSKKQFRRVIDSELLSYLSGKPGLVVLRPVRIEDSN
ncbi:MAG: DUF1460 domain-containing protein [Thermodesulfobacteriota bacterium]|nr:DUF1460 domain-containing protein [Thermodesulfobacteriota bacterium]